MLQGIIGINKPKGPTSHDIVDQVRRITGERKVGHAGTLDPLASGVLVVAIGRENTKKISEIVKTEKEYIAKVKLGETSTTDDGEGEKVKSSNVKGKSIEEIKQILDGFVGEIEQIPPVYSAIKMKGKKAYELARQGKDVKMEPRKVFIKKIELFKYEWPYLEIKVVCGPGVYIRSLARDIGEKLGTGAYMAELERTRVGEFAIQDAVIL
ncbi:tRNA pseudouridine(55) synthase TruB [Candidatus Kuenenbacteria bacterium]|nr:tRNA pseudouridine(55) synthase TruB [Candidatus Kuenenbacteria bacterium]